MWCNRCGAQSKWFNLCNAIYVVCAKRCTPCGAVYVLLAYSSMWCELCGASYVAQSMWQTLAYSSTWRELRGVSYVVRPMWKGLKCSDTWRGLCGASFVVGAKVLVGICTITHWHSWRARAWGFLHCPRCRSRHVGLDIKVNP